MDGVTILHNLEHQVALRPDADALVVGSETLCYAQLLASVKRMAAWLSASGVEPGDRVVFEAASTVVTPLVYFGILWRGAVCVPVDAAGGADATAAIAARVDAALVLAKKEMDGLGDVLHGAEDAPAMPAVPRRSADLCEVVFSSGTTGAPKGVMLTHGNVAAAVTMINGILGNGSADREVVTISLSHSFGLGRLRCILSAGGTVILVPGLRFPGLALSALEEHEATGLACVPAGLNILQTAARGEFGRIAHSLRYVELGSAPMSAEAKRALCEVLPDVRILMHYGLTEASRTTFLNFSSDDDHLASVGRPNPVVTIEIRGEDGAVLPADNVGTVFVQGETVTPGYWRDDALTGERIQSGGWLDTRDLGWLDDHGYLHLAGRADDQINVGGNKFTPDIVEQAAQTHSQVLEAACVGVFDNLLGQVPHLFVVLNGVDMPDDLIATVSRQVPDHAVPHHVDRIDALPRTASGKLQRMVLRQTVAGQT